MNELQILALMHARGIPERWDHPTAKDWAGVLAKFPLFTGVSKRRLRELARHATRAEFAPGERSSSPATAATSSTSSSAAR